VEVDGGAWTSLCGSDTDNSTVSVASHESRPPRLLAGASVVKARRLDGDGRGSVEAVVASGPDRSKEAARWRRARNTKPGGECGAEEAIGDGV
jgi:hypothetical protein